MHSSERFQKLIEYLNRTNEVEVHKKRHLVNALEYFKRQLLTDIDRRDSDQQLHAAWTEFQLLLRGSKIFQKFQGDETFWRSLEASVGVIHIRESIPETPKRQLRAEDFFIEIAKEVSSSMPESSEKNLLLFGLWYLQVEARLARPFRSQDRIKLAYKILHPRLKLKGLLKKYEGDAEMESAVKYFVKGSIY